MQQVTADDWASALASAPAPGGRRGGHTVLGAAAAVRPLPPHLAAALLPALGASLQALRAAAVPLPGPAAAAAVAAWDSQQQLAAELVRCRVLTPPGGSSDSLGAQQTVFAPAAEPSGRPAEHGAAHSSASAAGAMAQRAFGLLLAGEGEAGQQASAGALLRLFEDGQLHTLSLPTMLVTGECTV